MKVILSINAGSSSVKISAYVADKKSEPRQIAELEVSGLTAPPARLKYSRYGQPVALDDAASAAAAAVGSQDDAFRLLLDTLVGDEQLLEIDSRSKIAVACHRIVHGGDYDDSKLINSETYHHLEELSDLAPLHNGPALDIVSFCAKQLPEAANVACFDTQFHASMPAHIVTYAINPEVARKNHLRKYGFHGLSYAFITRSVAGFLSKDPSQVNLIALHLGSGASVCAIKAGQSLDTSMGLTPLAGLPGATRSGSVDPSLVFHYASDVGKLSPASTAHLHISRAEEILNRESGWKALTGTTDFGTIAASQEPQHQLAFDLFVDRVCGFIGAYYVALGGNVDALVFAGGIGERSARLRRAVVDAVACLGFRLDEARNQAPVPPEAVVCDLGPDPAPASHRVLVCQTDEQYEMARACAMKDELWA